jgi:hypothetical protein
MGPVSKNQVKYLASFCSKKVENALLQMYFYFYIMQVCKMLMNSIKK